MRASPLRRLAPFVFSAIAAVQQVAPTGALQTGQFGTWMFAHLGADAVKRGHLELPKKLMLAAVSVSALFLVSYVVYVMLYLL